MKASSGLSDSSFLVEGRKSEVSYHFSSTSSYLSRTPTALVPIHTCVVIWECEFTCIICVFVRANAFDLSITSA